MRVEEKKYLPLNDHHRRSSKRTGKNVPVENDRKDVADADESNASQRGKNGGVTVDSKPVADCGTLEKKKSSTSGLVTHSRLSNV